MARARGTRPGGGRGGTTRLTLPGRLLQLSRIVFLVATAAFSDNCTDFGGRGVVVNVAKGTKMYTAICGSSRYVKIENLQCKFLKKRHLQFKHVCIFSYVYHLPCKLRYKTQLNCVGYKLWPLICFTHLSYKIVHRRLASRVACISSRK